MNTNVFKEFIGIKNIENYKEKLSIKIIFQQLLLLATFIAFLTLVILSYTNGNQNIGINDLDDKLELRLYRALFPVFLSWYLFASIWSIKTGLDLWQSNQRNQSILLLLSFVPIFSLWNIGFFATGVNKSSIDYYKNLLFGKDLILQNEYRWGSWRRYVLLGLLLVLSPIVVFVFFPDSESGQELIHEQSIWFYSFHYFTIQTNVMIFLFTLVAFICPWLKVFKNNNLQIVLIVYIFIVGLVWNALLLPASISEKRFELLPTFKKVSTFWYHLVNPIVFITCSLVLIFKQPFKQSTKFHNIFWIGMPYPTMYLLYVVLLPFTAGLSVYGNFTNVNPDLGLNGEVGTDKVVYGSYWFILLIIGFWFVFLLLITLIWYLDKKVNTSKIQKM